MSHNIHPADGTEPERKPTTPYPGRAQLVALRAIHEAGAGAISVGKRYEHDGETVGDIRAAKAAGRPTFLAGDTLIAPQTVEALVAKGWLEIKVAGLTWSGEAMLQEFSGSQLRLGDDD